MLKRKLAGIKHPETCHCQECIDAYIHRSHNYGVITREKGDIPGCIPFPSEDEYIIEGLKRPSIADFYCDAIRRYVLRFKGDPLFIDKDKLAAYLGTRNVPPGWKPTTPKLGEELWQSYPDYFPPPTESLLALQDNTTPSTTTVWYGNATTSADTPSSTNGTITVITVSGPSSTE